MKLPRLARRLSEPRRRKRRPPEQAPREIVPSAPPVPVAGDPFDAARERLRREIPPPQDD